MRKETAKERTDGRVTRQALIDAAGILAARRGWSSVCAKDVCELAGMSTASVNYWFGGRTQLYREVVGQISEGIFDTDLEAFLQSNAEPLEKIRKVLEAFLMASRDRSRWRLALWAREMFTGPSEEFLRMKRTNGIRHMNFVRQTIADYLGMSGHGAQIEVVVMSILAPCMLMVASSPEFVKESYPSLLGYKGKEAAVEQLLEMLRSLKQARESRR